MDAVSDSVFCIWMLLFINLCIDAVNGEVGNHTNLEVVKMNERTNDYWTIIEFKINLKYRRQAVDEQVIFYSLILFFLSSSYGSLHADF